MATTVQIKTSIANYLQTTVAALTVNAIDLTLLALNNAMQAAERVHDFYYSQANATLSITSSGGVLAANIKRVQNVILPVNGGFIPIEFLTYDQWNSRLRMQAGRTPYDPARTTWQLGVSASNPTCFQQGQTLFLVPASQFTFPVTASLSIIQFLPLLAADSDTNFFTLFAPDFLQWQGVIECNKLIKFFVQRQEGNLDETNLQAEASNSFQSLIAWDRSIRDGTSTPLVNTPPPVAPQPQAA